MRKRLSPPQEKASYQFFLLALMALAFSFAILSNLKHEISDEGFHAPVVFKWLNGDFSKPDYLTVPPAYHALIAGVMYAVDLSTVKSMRFISLLFASLSIVCFYFLSKLVNEGSVKEAENRTSIFILCPIILPFFSLIYTDMCANMWVFALTLSSLLGRHWLAACFAIVAMLFRQSAVIWVAFCFCYYLCSLWFQSSNAWRERAIDILKINGLNLLPYIGVMLLFAIYLLLNKSVSVGDKQLQRLSFNLSNIYFCLLLCFFLFLPFNLRYRMKILNLLKCSVLVWVFIVSFLVLYVLTYNNSHQYNSMALSFFLRNVVLHYTVTQVFLKLLAFFAISWMALTLYLMAEASKHKWRLYLLYVFSFLSLVPFPVVEQRYYIVAISFFMIWRPKTHDNDDRVLMFAYIPISAALLYGIAQYRFFI